MVNIILLFGLFNLMKIANSLCATDNICHDGGCNNVTDESISPTCECSFSQNVMYGTYCGLYEDKCDQPSRCMNNGNCQSGIGHKICNCPKQYSGSSCEIEVPINYTFNVMKRPSIYYRIKSKQGEELNILLVADTFGNDNYEITIKGVLQNFRLNLKGRIQKVSVSQLIQKCSNDLGSEEFKVNNCNGPDNNDCQNMCNFIPKLYGYENEVEIAIIGPYYNTKSQLRRQDIYFNNINVNNNRIGGKYNLEIEIRSTNLNKLVYSFPFIQFIVDDELTNCLPFIGYSLNQDSNLIIEEIYQRHVNTTYRNSKWMFKFQLYQENSNMCTKPNYEIEEQFQWKAFDLNNTINSYANDKGIMELNKSLRDEPMYLILKLPIGNYILYFRLIVKNLRTGSNTSNSYMRFIEVKLQGLIAKITGSSPIILRNNTFLTLDASESYNPNEDDIKANLLFTWECNIKEDASCKKFTTEKPKTTLRKYLNKSAEYIFTLTLSVDIDYITKIGKPDVGVATIEVHLDQSTTTLNKEIRIKCIQNCEPVSNPLVNLHLEIEMNFIGNEFIWQYQQLNDTNMNSIDDIALTGLPMHMLVVNKNMLNYGATYNFIIKYPKYSLKNNIYITTISRPTIGNCTLLPDSGLAEKTLFTLSLLCIHSENEHIIEYYQKNKNDNSTMGVLLDQGNGTAINLKLTSSKYIIIKTINKYGVSVQEHLVVNVLEYNVNLLKKLFNILRFHLKNKDNSKAVSLMAILSDILHDNNINKFNQLLKAFNKIPIKNCIFCINQFVLILQKVINDYYKYTNGKMETNELLKISKQLLRVSNSLFEYKKMSYDNHNMADIIRIQEIQKVLQKNIIFIQNHTNSYENLIINNPDRNFWSSFNKLKTLTQYIEELVTYFGKSVILELTPYKRPIICEDKIYDLKACILSPEWVRNRSSHSNSQDILYNTIGQALASELLTIEENWGITMFNIKNNLIQKFNKVNNIEIIMPIISLDLLSIKNSNPNSIATYKKSENYIDLYFKTNDTIKIQNINYTIPIQNTTPDINEAEFDKNILVYKIDMKNIGELYVTLSDSTHDLRFTWLRGIRPDNEIMKDESYTIKLTAGEKNEFTLKTFESHRDEIHYIGIAADMNSTLNVNFSMDIHSQQCLYWNGAKWVADGIIVGPKTTQNNIHCQINHMSLFSGLIVTLPDVIDPIEEISHTDAIADNMVCIIAVVTVFIIYIILLIWAKYQDKKDILRGEIIILNDNYPGENEIYLVTVYTGYSFEAGTSANVCIQLHGTLGTSRAHWLYNPDCDVLQHSNDDWFIIFTTQSIGDLMNIHIWYDNYGNNPNWYCKRIEVIEVRRKKKWNFIVERWFSIENAEDSIDVEILQNWQGQAFDDLKLTIREELIWASVFIRHPRSLITRCQRLSKILCLLLSVMLISLIFYDFTENDEDDFLTFEITLTQFSISIQSSIIQTIMTFSTTYCFNKSAKFEKLVLVQNQIEEHRNENTWWKKLLIMIAEKKPYLPAQTENKFNKRSKNIRINYWLIIGWTLCFLIYGLSISLIIAYGLKLGQVKCLHWLMTIVITIIQSAFLAEPLQILITSYILIKFNQEQNIIATYKIKLDNYRKNTKTQLQNLELIKRIREGRRRYIYHPLTQINTQILKNKQRDKIQFICFRENAITCILIILTSLCCINALYSFGSPQHVIHANNINKLFVKSLLQTNMMDLEMLKVFLTESFVDLLHIKEYYNGIPIVNDSKIDLNNARGWYSLYNSKLINGGIRLKQNRIKEDSLEWKSDLGNYEKGWKETTTDSEDITAWTYRSIFVNKYFGLWFPETDNSGFILDLTGELFEYKKKLKIHLENGWLDNRTRKIDIEFQTYTPNIDCITVFNIRLQTVSGLLFTINTKVWTVPSSSVLVTWSTYAFTLAFTSAYATIAVRLTNSVTRAVSSDHVGGAPYEPRFWTAYDCALLTIAVAATFTVAGRWRLMEVAGMQYSTAKESEYVASVTDMCRAHEHLAALVSVAVAMAVFRTLRLVAYAERESHAERVFDASGGSVALVAAYAMVSGYGAWHGHDGHGFLNAFVVGQLYGGETPYVTVTAVAVFLFLNAAIVAIITKSYVISKRYLRRG